MLRKQAKAVSSRELKRLLDYAAHGRYPERDRVLVLLSFKAGLRAKEIAALRWSMVTDSRGQLADHLALPDRAGNRRNGGRVVPMHRDLRVALAILMIAEPDKVRSNRPVIYSERGSGYSANAVAVWFHNRYKELGIQGASGHSGRRSFITAAARKIVEAGGSLRDVQELAGHASVATTQRYIEGNSAAKRKVIALI